MFDRCLEAGKDALLIKAADILDNSHYFGSNENLLEKMRYFIEFSRESLKEERVWKELRDQYIKNQSE